MKKAAVLTISLFVILFCYAQLKSTTQKKVVIEAGDEIVIKTGDASITLKKNGAIIIEGNVTSKSNGDVIIKGSKLKEN